ncbi:MAG TPA: hypothetical protein VL197_11850 [Nitrospirota bacterium]|nr:hypothetical protein [Nitrospirota bacterium]
MEGHAMPQEKKLMLHGVLAGALPPIVFLAVVLAFAHQRQGLIMLVAGLAASTLLLGAVMGAYQALGSVLSLIIGIAGGIALVLLYGAILQHRDLTGRGWLFIACWALVSALAEYWGVLRAARKTAEKYPEIEKGRVVRILLYGNAAAAIGSLIVMVYLTVIAKVIS